ncbi:MAG: molybdenum cofactor guanylyltransferase MobA [Gammaproteobacteria bacterium]|nr:molybdenum cofactor guanylyltransferase MobA [Gammaproteobacteria bacterium]
MDGLDKGMVEFRNMPLIEHVLHRIAPQVDALMINANRNFDFYAASGLPVVPDERLDFAGPLAGIEASLSKAPTPLALIVPCDTPFLPTDLVSRMIDVMHKEQADVVIPDDGEREQPLICLMKTSLKESISRVLDANSPKVRDWLALQNLAWVDFSDQPDAFANINDAETLEKLSGHD